MTVLYLENKGIVGHKCRKIMRETADVIRGMKTENKEHVIYYSDKPFQATLLAVADFMVASVYNFLYWLGKNIYVTFKKHV